MESNLASIADPLAEAQARYRAEQQVEAHAEASLKRSGWLENALTPPAERAESKPSQLGVWKIAAGVLLGNIMTGVIAGLVYYAATH